MTAADEIRVRYPEAFESAEIRYRSERDLVCELCTGPHQTNVCPLGRHYIEQIDTVVITPAEVDCGWTPAERRAAWRWAILTIENVVSGSTIDPGDPPSPPRVLRRAAASADWPTRQPG